MTVVDRCHMVAVRISVGRAGTVIPVQCGASAWWTASTTTACSWRSLTDSSSVAARRTSSARSWLRGVDPASGLATTWFPWRETSSSGLAPIRVRSGPVGSAKV